MAEQRKVKEWITINGRHVPIFEDESIRSAIKREFGITPGGEEEVVKEGKGVRMVRKKKLTEEQKKELNSINREIERDSERKQTDEKYRERMERMKRIHNESVDKEKQIADNKKEVISLAGKEVQKQIKKQISEENKRISKGMTTKASNDIKKLADRVLKEEMGPRKSLMLVKELWEKSDTSLSLMDFATAYNNEINRRLYND